MFKKLQQKKFLVAAIVFSILSIICFLIFYNPFVSLYEQKDSINADFSAIGDMDNVEYNAENQTVLLKSMEGNLIFKLDKNNQVIENSIRKVYASLYIPRMVVYCIIIGLIGFLISPIFSTIFELIPKYGNFKKKDEVLY